MADPSIQTFCCNKPEYSSPALSISSEFNSVPYNVVCMVSSILGISGALYQLLPRTDSSSQRWFSFTSLRSKQIITSLAVADLCASLGVFIRSIVKLNDSSFVRVNSTGNLVFCIILAAWIEYFFVVTWMWTLFYSIDMWRALQQKPGYPKIYHSICWTFPAVLTAIGLSILYIPDANCHNLEPGGETFIRLLPNYLVTYIPIATVMIVNPILYMLSIKAISSLIANCLSQFTRKERSIIETVRLRFGCINLAFYICWLPNIINGILMWSFWYQLPRTTLLVLWYIMGITNPLQALLNCIVYKRTNQRIVNPFKWTNLAEITPLISPNLNS